MPTPKLRVQVSPTGFTTWGPLPETTNYYLVWMGVGSRLYLGVNPFSVEGSFISIDHPTADGVYNTRREAAIAVDAFMEAS